MMRRMVSILPLSFIRSVSMTTPTDPVDKKRTPWETRNHTGESTSKTSGVVSNAPTQDSVAQGLSAACSMRLTPCSSIVNDSFTTNAYLTRIVGNRRCAVLAADTIKAVLSPTHDNSENPQTNGAAVKIAPTTMSLTNSPPTPVNSIPGFVAWSTAQQYAEYNEVKGLSPTERALLVQKVVQAFLEARDPSLNAWECFHKEPVTDAIRYGLLMSGDPLLFTPSRALEKGAATRLYKGVDKITYTFSPMQLTLACMVYGSSMDAANHPESQEALSITLLSLFITTYKKSWGLRRFLKLVDPDWKGMCTTNSDEAACLPEASLPDEASYTGDNNATMLENIDRLPFADAADAHALSQHINEARRKQPVVRVLFSPKCSFADGLLVWGDILLLVQAQLDTTWHRGDWRDVLLELLKCGFSVAAEGLTEAQKQFLNDNKGTYEVNRKLTEQLVERCSIKHILFVMSVPEEYNPFIRTVGLSVQAPGLQETNVYPLLIFPDVQLSAAFQKTTLKNDGEVVWQSVHERD